MRASKAEGTSLAVGFLGGVEVCRVIGTLAGQPVRWGKFTFGVTEVGGASGGAGPGLPAHLSTTWDSFLPSERSEEQSFLLTWPMESEGTRHLSQVTD